MAAIQRSAFYSKRGEIGSEEKIKTMIGLCTRTQGKLFLQKCEHSFKFTIQTPQPHIKISN